MWVEKGLKMPEILFERGLGSGFKNELKNMK